MCRLHFGLPAARRCGSIRIESSTVQSNRKRTGKITLSLENAQSFWLSLPFLGWDFAPVFAKCYTCHAKMVCERWCARLCVKDGVWQSCVWKMVKGGVWQRWVRKMVCEREHVTKLCERWCVTKMGVKDGVVKDGVWQGCVWKMVWWKMVCDQVVCKRWCVRKMVYDKDVGERWCGERWCTASLVMVFM